MRTKRGVWLALPVVILFVVAGCGGGGNSTMPSTGGSSGDQAMVSYVRCMRSQGIDFPDPFHRAGHAGLTLNFPPESVKASAVYTSADGVCGHFIQPLVDAKRAGARPNPEQLSALVDYSRCMRDHQIPLLDPDPADGHISVGNVPGIPEAPGGRNGTLFGQADQACRHLLPAHTPDDGTGPP